jgi:hypothetical protein
MNWRLVCCLVLGSASCVLAASGEGPVSFAAGSFLGGLALVMVLAGRGDVR